MLVSFLALFLYLSNYLRVGVIFPAFRSFFRVQKSARILGMAMEMAVLAVHCRYLLLFPAFDILDRRLVIRDF